MDINQAFAQSQPTVDPDCTGTVLHKLIDGSFSRSDLIVRLIIKMCYNVITYVSCKCLGFGVVWLESERTIEARVLESQKLLLMYSTVVVVRCVCLGSAANLLYCYW
jgi:hypothetical protein